MAALLVLLNTISFGAQQTVLVAPFRNTGTGEYDWLSAGMTAAVQDDISGHPDFSLFPYKNAVAVLKAIEAERPGVTKTDARRIVRAISTGFLLSAVYEVRANTVSLTAYLGSVEGDTIVRKFTRSAELEEVVDLQHQIAPALLGGEEDSRWSAHAGKRTSIDKPALRAYEFYCRGLSVKEDDPASALAFFERAIREKTDYIDALSDAGWVAGQKLGRSHDAIRYLGAADSILTAGKTDQRSRRVNVLIDLGIQYMTVPMVDHALTCFQRAREILTKLQLNNSAKDAHALAQMGIAYRMKGEFDTALQAQLTAKSILERLGYEGAISYAMLLNGLGSTYEALGERLKARKAYGQCRVALTKLGYDTTPLYSSVLMNIGNTYPMQASDTVLVYYLACEELLDTLGLENTREYASVLMNIGNRTLETMNPAEAYPFYAKARRVLDSLGLVRTSLYANLATNLGNMYRDREDLVPALACYVLANRLRDSLSLQNTVAYGHTLFGMAQLFELDGDREGMCDHVNAACEAYKRAGYNGPAKAEADRYRETVCK